MEFALTLDKPSEKSPSHYLSDQKLDFKHRQLKKLPSYFFFLFEWVGQNCNSPLPVRRDRLDTPPCQPYGKMKNRLEKLLEEDK